MGNKLLIVLAICTRDLAVFEAICAQGLARLSYPRGFRYKLLIVENRRESTGDPQPIGIDIPVHYVLERKLGLSAARNRVFTEAVKLNADWPLSFPMTPDEVKSDNIDVNDSSQVLWREFPVKDKYVSNDQGLVACRITNTINCLLYTSPSPRD